MASREFIEQSLWAVHTCMLIFSPGTRWQIAKAFNKCNSSCWESGHVETALKVVSSSFTPVRIYFTGITFTCSSTLSHVLRTFFRPDWDKRKSSDSKANKVKPRAARCLIPLALRNIFITKHFPFSNHWETKFNRRLWMKNIWFNWKTPLEYSILDEPQIRLRDWFTFPIPLGH